MNKNQARKAQQAQKKSSSNHTTKEGATTNRLLAIGAYWQNDQPHGIGIRYHFKGDHGDRVAAHIEGAMPGYDALATKEEILAQLRDWGTDKGCFERDERLGIVAIMNIYWLETRGHLQSDEFNGCVFGRAYGRDRISTPAL